MDKKAKDCFYCSNVVDGVPTIDNMITINDAFRGKIIKQVIVNLVGKLTKIVFEDNTVLELYPPTEGLLYYY